MEPKTIEDMAKEIASLKEQRDDLQTRNTQLLERARSAEEKTVSVMTRKAFQIALEKGWHDQGKPSWAEHLVNIHGEVSELWEAFRRGKLHHQCEKDADMTCAEEELADIVIRCMHVAAQNEIDLEKAILTKHEFNRTRPYRHGGKVA